MSRFKLTCLSAIAFAVVICLFIANGCSTPKKAPAAAAAPASLKPLGPGPNDPRIANQTAQYLETAHYTLHPFDRAMSEKFFDGYLALLDQRRENFLQSDIDEFSHYRTNLDKLTLGDHSRADLTPAFEIFLRFRERLTQRTDYVDQLLKQDRFKFNTDERIQRDRKHAAYPKDLAEAMELWSRQLRYEYLQEKLAREFSPTNGGTILPLPKSADAEITAQLTRRYSWTLRYYTNWDSDNVLQIYLNALTHAYDPHTDYLNVQHAADFRISMSLQLAGIGAQLQDDYGYCTIDRLIPGGPADKSAQIKPKDRIIAVAQSNGAPVNVVGMELANVVELIRGPKGTQVRLTLQSKDNPSPRPPVILTRDIIKLEDQEAKARLIELPDSHGGTNRIGVISVPSFYAPIDSDAHNYISVDVAKLIKKLEREKVAGILLDMRGNPGGSLEEAIRFTGLFIKAGPVVLARDSDGQIQLNSATEPEALYTGPLVVLINRLSASAAEIAAAALQDYGRAVVVGDTSTHGKGTVQQIIPLNKSVRPATPTATNDPGELKITIRKFYRVTGATTQLKGVEPDIVLPDLYDAYTDMGERALENALPGIPLPQEIASRIHYDRLNLVQPHLTDLHRRSESRIASNQDFAYVRQDIAQYEKIVADKFVTINEQEAIRQRQAEDARKLAQAAEEAVRPLPNVKIYDLTVENSATNGLPEPEALCVTNLNALLTSTNANGSVCIMTTNNIFGVGVVLDRFETNTPAGRLHMGTVVTKPQPDVMLEETEHILEDLISSLSKNPVLTANP